MHRILGEGRLPETDLLIVFDKSALFPQTGVLFYFKILLDCHWKSSTQALWKVSFCWTRT